MKTTGPTSENTAKRSQIPGQQTKTGIAAFIISVIATIAAIRALMFINYGVHSPLDAALYRWSVILSLGLPFLSIILGLAGTKTPQKSNLMGAIGIGASLFLLSTVGFAYFLSALF